MKAEILWWRQGTGISRDEWRLQRRSWGTWIVGLFLLAFVVSEHPAFTSMSAFSITRAAGTWADRVVVIGSFVAVLTVPFTLDRARRQRVAPIEFTKPFERLAYVWGKFAGAVAPLAFVTVLSLLIHFLIAWVTVPNVSFLQAITAYLHQAVLIVFVPLLYFVSIIYCLSVYISRPILIVPLFIFYLTMSSLSQASANAKFSWWSPIVRPDYFSYEIPAAWVPLVWAHQGFYFLLSILALALAVYGFQRSRFVDEKSSVKWWRRIHIPLPAQLGIKVRILWGGHIVAALIMAFFAIMNTLRNPETNPIWQAEYALFGLEFWLAISGLLLLAGVVARDNSVRALDLILSKPVNRWRLLGERLLPALIIELVFCVFAVAILRAVYDELPILKALLVAISTGLYLGMFGLTVANLTRSDLAGYGAGLIYWLFEAGLDGRFTAPFYLFIVSNQVDAFTLETWDSEIMWLPVKLGLLFLSLWLFLMNGWLLDPGPAKRRALIALAMGYPVIFILGWWLMPMFAR